MTKRHLWRVTFYLKKGDLTAGYMVMHFIFHEPTHDEVLKAFEVEDLLSLDITARILAGDYRTEEVACYEVLRGR